MHRIKQLNEQFGEGKITEREYVRGLARQFAAITDCITDDCEGNSTIAWVHKQLSAPEFAGS